MNLKFSVVTVSYNAAPVIEKTIASVLGQTYTPYEYIIMDGGSTDNTLECVEKYAIAFEQKGIILKVFSEPDTGIYNAMNKGIGVACGDFLSFLNAGDWYEADALESIQTFYNEEPFDLSYGGLHYIYPNGKISNKMSKDDKRGIVTSRHWNHPSMFLRTELYKKYRFDEQYKAYADFDLYLKLRRADLKIRVIDKVITNFSVGGVSTSTKLKDGVGRAGEKYRSYVHNGYSRLYWFESYGWELFKLFYFKLKH